MIEISKNPFTPIEMWEDTMVTVNENDEKKRVDAKHYKIRYLVGESDDKRFVDGGNEQIAHLSEKTLYLSPAVHRLTGDPFHYDGARVESVTGSKAISERTKQLIRHAACEEHKTVEVIFESPGVECCAMSKEQADKMRVPLQYIAGYLLGKTDGLLKVALSKTVVDSGDEYYDNIHIIPESSIKQMACLE
ncbi:hypothetical protein EU527_16760 [Candidatus Thorarchaeota archaeon]|nr:MAG: hypothetical protein EU527_16760 [Candidatus Thorarchaeota archaeon]